MSVNKWRIFKARYIFPVRWWLVPPAIGTRFHARPFPTFKAACAAFAEGPLQ